MSSMITNRQGQSLCVQIQGLDNAPVIIFSNSLGTDQGMWQAQLDGLKDQFKIVTYDTRGHGQSDVMEQTTLQTLSEDVIDILDALNIEKAHFCGISMGGITGLWLAIYHPERFLSVTVANSAAKIWNAEGWNARADAVEQNGLDDLVATTHTRWFSNQFDYTNNSIAQKTIESLKNTPAKGYANACRALAQADVRQEMADIKIPVLLIAGTEDPVTTVDDAKQMENSIASSQLICINASHLSNIEQSLPFNQALTQFIQSI